VDYGSPGIIPEMGINYGLDFERACERLSLVAGRAFRRHLEVKRDPHTSAQAREMARDDYMAAQARYKALRPDQSAEIARILHG
jgi:hypothetical protein